ncbi:MAG: response regulator [Bacteroidetes bacterium]|nr:response regulator [Bacteroidota bacterium]
MEQLKKSDSDTAQNDFEIYIVDDDPAFSFMLKDYLLSAMEMQSKHFVTGAEFLKKYKANDSRKIILDYEFSDGPNGLFVLQKIKELNPTAVVIVVSGQDY